MRQVYNPPDHDEPTARAVKVGDILYVAGVSALSHLSGPLRQRTLPADFTAQVHQTFANLKTTLALAGATLDDVFRTTMTLRDRSDYDAIGALRAHYLPSRAYIGTGFIGRMRHPDQLIEISVEAYLPR